MRSALVRLLLLASTVAAFANPVPDRVAREFNDLPARVVRDHKEEDRKRLEANYGAFGIDLLTPSTLEFTAQKFDQLAPLMASSQGPPYRPSARLQDWYRAHARSAAQRTMMINSLKRWLTERVTEAPAEGSMRTTGPPEAVASEIFAVRVDAADLLADWSAREALVPMRALLRRVKESDREFIPLRESVRRVEEPLHAGFLVAGPGMRFALRRRFDELCSMDFDSHEGHAALSAKDRRACWALLDRSMKGPDSNWEASNDHLTVKFCDGVVADLSPTDPEIVTYSDNTHLGYRRRIQLKNPALYDFIHRVGKSASTKRR